MTDSTMRKEQECTEVAKVTITSSDGELTFELHDDFVRFPVISHDEIAMVIASLRDLADGLESIGSMTTSRVGVH